MGGEGRLGRHEVARGPPRGSYSVFPGQVDEPAAGAGFFYLVRGDDAGLWTPCTWRPHPQTCEESRKH